MLLYRRAIRSAIVCTLTTFSDTTVDAQESSANKQRIARAAMLLPYTGAYVIEPRHEIAIGLQQSSDFTVLVLYDIASDVVRALFPAGRDTFIAGPELTRPQPVAFTVVFQRNATSRITALRIAGVGWREGAVAQRLPLREEAASFTSGDVALSGTILSSPNATERRPAVVLVHGSEDADRYSFGALPYVLASHGFVTLMYDKRGTGKSSGRWSSAGLDELAQDVRAGLAFIAKRRDVDSTRVGLVGLSEGGWTAPLAASQAPWVAFIVAISGGGLTKAAAFIHKNRVRLAESGLGGARLDSALGGSIQTVAESRARVERGNSPTGFDRRLAYDPAAHWSSFRAPILSLGGEADALEDAVASALHLDSLLTRARHPDFTIKVFPRAHHGALFLGKTGRPSEWYGLQGITQIVPGFWDVLIRWLEVRFAP